MEAYLDVAQPNSAETGWRDMGMFWKIAAGIILAVMGAVVGIVGTINSQVTYRGVDRLANRTSVGSSRERNSSNRVEALP